MKTWIQLCALLALVGFGAEPKTPETSSLFVPEVDADSGVTSYILKPGLVDFNQQSIYFTAKSMTDDGRFLVFWTAPSEWTEPRPSERTRKLRLIDFQTDTVTEIDGAGGTIPYLDVKTDRLWWIDRDGLHRRDLLDDPHKDAFTLPLPPELKDSPTRGRFRRFCTHLTPTADGSRFFLDAENEHFNFQGMLNLATGRWEEWDRAHFLCNHGQASPTDVTLALCAQECAGTYTLDELAELGRPTEGVKLRVAPFVTDVRRAADAVYPRLWLCRKGGKRMVPPLLHNYATHENFTEDGCGVYYCGGAVTLLDLRTERQSVVSPLLSAHATMSSDLRYVTSDISDGGWWRGCKWRVTFFNRDTHRGILIHTSRPLYRPKDNQSRLHPDPHPQFVCHDRYIVCTVADSEHHLNVSVTPVAQLIAKTSDPKTAPTPRRIPLDWDPARPVDRPYEVTFDVVRMAQQGLVSRPPIACYASGNAYAVEAKVGGVWQDVPVRPLGHQNERKLTLRFCVPPGTTELSLIGDVSRRFSPCDTTGEENLFTGALSERCANRWRCSGKTAFRFCKEGVAISGGAGMATFETAVPASAAGKPVKLELHLFGISDACAADVRFVQVDGRGRDLADAVFGKLDGNCSAGKLVRHETGGRLSSAARRLRLEIAPSSAASRLRVQRLNLRVGEDLDLKAK